MPRRENEGGIVSRALTPAPRAQNIAAPARTGALVSEHLSLHLEAGARRGTEPYISLFGDHISFSNNVANGRAPALP